ncbi:Pyruvate dehydrogenase E1 component beta subunit [Staphylococcus aureus]|nr:Pyruvate dehydrogenase E1 component beta subunit [Staphylococcus aureus]CAA3868500.1 Pyruvate dehydrogenase E1 component beta subunit [Staphylococcus aureus]SUK09133.1 Pyruvate dehydrogenase E1 component beta subunit [Staphylococcus aureus]VDZ11864.1 Pyruvate dehydrogenase E1 component beta subunit [Staphylococcus aureus]
MAQMTMVQAINDALKTELKNDQDVLILVKTLVLTAVFSVLLKDYKKNLVKIEYSIHL